MLKLFLFVIFIIKATSADTETTLECPFPNGQDDSSEEECSRYSACAWSEDLCYLRGQDQAGYKVVEPLQSEDHRLHVKLRKISPELTMFDDDISHLLLEVLFHEPYHIQLKITDIDHERYEVPVPLNLPLNNRFSIDDSEFVVNITEEVDQPLRMNIARKDTGTNIFDLIGPLLYEDQFIELSTKVASEWMYGFGYSTHSTFKRRFNPRQTFPIFARDHPVGPGEVNEYSHHPYFQVIEDDAGNTHSVLFFNSNAMEYSTFLLSDGFPALTLRTTGGIIDMHFFLGDSPEDSNKKYINMIGLPMLPQYWSLGFHVSRWGYSDPQHIRDVRERMKAMGIPQDGQTIDIDYMDHYRDFTYDHNTWSDLPDLIQELHNDGVKITLIIDPALVIDWDNYPPAQRGKDADIFIKWMSESLIPDDQEESCLDYLVGYVWPNNKTVFPDYLNPKSHDWLAEELAILYKDLQFDAIWMDMNEPANFGTNVDRPFNYPPELPDWSLKCPYSRYDSPPYPTKSIRVGNPESNRLSDHTICMSSAHVDNDTSYLHYNVHSIYGWSSTVALNHALERLKPTERPALLSRSTFPGSGQYITHWLGDNSAEWEAMSMSVIGMLEFNMFGIPMIGADICGFFNEPDMEMCARWTQLGAFYPFSRNHNAEGTADQDPGMWPEVAEVARGMLNLRYKYIPYLYSLFYNAHKYGSTVIRPLLNTFPTDVATRTIDDQFMWGDGIMIAPVMTQGSTSRDVYFPQSNWYLLKEGNLVSEGSETIDVDAPLSSIPVYVRGGVILPYQEPGLNTQESRKNDFGLTVALDTDLEAHGELFWDDGVSVVNEANVFYSMFDFRFNNTNYQLTSKVAQTSDASSDLSFKFIVTYGFPSEPTSVTSQSENLEFTYDVSSKVLNIIFEHPINEGFTILIA